MMSLKNFLLKRKASKDRKAIQGALDLHNRGEVRRDGLTLTHASHHLKVEWRAREVHPWDRASASKQREFLLAEQSMADTDAALGRLFNELPEVDVIEFHCDASGFWPADSQRYSGARMSGALHSECFSEDEVMAQRRDSLDPFPCGARAGFRRLQCPIADNHCWTRS